MKLHSFSGVRQSLFTGFILMCIYVASSATEKLPAGWVERVRLYPGKLELLAKLDTGADISSLHARGLTRYLRGGREWISFDVVDGAGDTVRFEKPVIRTSRIRRHGGKVEERPVIMLGLCLGDVFLETEVSLADRSGFDYPLLIGRAFMASHVVIDPSRTLLLVPGCEIRAAAQ